MTAAINPIYAERLEALRANPAVWLVTGAAGFIGSNLVEMLLANGQTVRGLDNFATGHARNLDEVRGCVGDEAFSRFTFLEDDITDEAACVRACEGVDYVLHQAALGSVPRSLATPLATHRTNIDGFIYMLDAARLAGVRSFTYAASSSTYGDHEALPKVEDRIGKPLSPYAVTKYVNELYAEVYARSYGFQSVGLRYFNVFGRRQDPDGAYAAVIPKWVGSLLSGEGVFINGDGETSRDFCYIDNVVQANILAATTDDPDARNQVYNVAAGDRTTLNTLFDTIRDLLSAYRPGLGNATPHYRDFRPGDVRHSQADISKVKERLGYEVLYRVDEGLGEAIDWYVDAL